MAAKAHKDKPVYAFIRKGNALVPEMNMDCRALDGIAQGQRVRLDVKHWRNMDRLRAYWAMLHDCIDATECAPNVGALHSLIKLDTGLVDLVRLPNGFTVAVPGSIAIEAMREPDMIAFFEAAQRYLAAKFGFVSAPARNVEAA